MKRGLAGACVLALLVACTGSTPASTNHASQIRIGELNIEYGGVVVDFDQTVAAAEALDADVVAIEEAWGHIPRLAAAMGWSYYDVRRQIVSRLPLVRAPGDPQDYIFIELAPGQVAAIGNVHLASGAYGPNRTRTGDTARAVLEGERKLRVPEIEPYATALADVAAAGVPSFLVGDFNSPSHLDWTPAAVGTRPQIVYPLDWPVTETLATLGFVDSFRQVYPDPIADPGLTWPAARPKAMNGGWNPGRDAPADRIDYVQSIGPATAIGSSVVGEDVVDPWPSDHRGLVSTFSVTPEAPPDLVSPDQALGEVGDEMTVRYRVGEGSGRITATAAGGGSPAATLDVSTADGSVALDTSGWAPGRYDLALAGSAGTTIATSTIWVAAPGHGPTLDVPRVVGEGDAIRASWTDAPGNRWDWIGIYHRGADPHVAYYLLWAYTEATIEGSVALDRSAVGTFPLPPGRYTALLLVDDSYRPVASADFTIR